MTRKSLTRVEASTCSVYSTEYCLNHAVWWQGGAHKGSRKFYLGIFREQSSQKPVGQKSFILEEVSLGSIDPILFKSRPTSGGRVETQRGQGRIFI